MPTGTHICMTFQFQASGWYVFVESTQLTQVFSALSEPKILFFLNIASKEKEKKANCIYWVYCSFLSGFPVFYYGAVPLFIIIITTHYYFLPVAVLFFRRKFVTCFPYCSVSFAARSSRILSHDRNQLASGELLFVHIIPDNQYTKFPIFNFLNKLPYS